MAIYLDNAAAMPPDAETADFFRRALLKCGGNQEAIHGGAYALRRELSAAAVRLSVALTGSGDCDVIWGNSGTEVIDLFFALTAPGRRVIANALEHPAVTAAAHRYGDEVVNWACGPGGRVIPGESRKGDVLALHWVQSELGVIQNVDELLAQQPSGVVKFVDAIQGAGKLPGFPRLADAAAISGVKFGAPGGAALLVSKRFPGAKKLLAQAAAARREHRTGRMNPALALTLAYAAERRARTLEADCRRLAELVRVLRLKLEKAGVRATLPEAAVSPFVLHLDLGAKQGAVVVRLLSESGVFASSGSACAAETAEPSPALLALGWSRRRAYCGLRLSFGFAESASRLEKVARTLKKQLQNY